MTEMGTVRVLWIVVVVTCSQVGLVRGMYTPSILSKSPWAVPSLCGLTGPSAVCNPAKLFGDADVASIDTATKDLAKATDTACPGGQGLDVAVAVIDGIVGTSTADTPANLKTTAEQFSSVLRQAFWRPGVQPCDNGAVITYTEIGPTLGMAVGNKFPDLIPQSTIDKIINDAISKLPSNPAPQVIKDVITQFQSEVTGWQQTRAFLYGLGSVLGVIGITLIVLLAVSCFRARRNKNSADVTNAEDEESIVSGSDDPPGGCCICCRNEVDDEDEKVLATGVSNNDTGEAIIPNWASPEKQPEEPADEAEEAKDDGQIEMIKPKKVQFVAAEPESDPDEQEKELEPEDKEEPESEPELDEDEKNAQEEEAPKEHPEEQEADEELDKEDTEKPSITHKEDRTIFRVTLEHDGMKPGEIIPVHPPTPPVTKSIPDFTINMSPKVAMVQPMIQTVDHAPVHYPATQPYLATDEPFTVTAYQVPSKYSPTMSSNTPLPIVTVRDSMGKSAVLINLPDDDPVYREAPYEPPLATHLPVLRSSSGQPVASQSSAFSPTLPLPPPPPTHKIVIAPVHQKTSAPDSNPAQVDPNANTKEIPTMRKKKPMKSGTTTTIPIKSTQQKKVESATESESDSESDDSDDSSEESSGSSESVSSEEPSEASESEASELEDKDAKDEDSEASESEASELEDKDAKHEDSEGADDSDKSSDSKPKSEEQDSEDSPDSQDSQDSQDPQDSQGSQDSQDPVDLQDAQDTQDVQDSKPEKSYNSKSESPESDLDESDKLNDDSEDDSEVEIPTTSLTPSPRPPTPPTTSKARSAKVNKRKTPAKKLSVRNSNREDQNTRMTPKPTIAKKWLPKKGFTNGKEIDYF